MGANVSRIPDNRAPVAPALIPPACSAFPENNAAANKHQYTLPDCTTPPPSAATAATAALALPTMVAPNTKRITAFHSAATWSAYFEASKASNKLIVVDFTAAWCGPCRYMEPILNEFAARYTDVDFVKIDVDELFNVSREFGVQAMPTFTFIKKGKGVDKVVGARKEELQRKIEQHRT